MTRRPVTDRKRQSESPVALASGGSYGTDNVWEGIATGPGWQGSDGPPPNIIMHGTWSGLVTNDGVVLTNAAHCQTGHPADHQSF